MTTETKICILADIFCESTEWIAVKNFTVNGISCLIMQIIPTFISVQSLICVQLFATPWTAAHQAPPSVGFSRQEYWSGVSLPSPPTPWVYSNSCPLSRWCHPNISSSVILFSCLQSFSASGSFQISQFFTLGGQRIGVSASASFLPMNIQDWFPLGQTHWISFRMDIFFLQSKELSRVFSNTTVPKHQFIRAQVSL